MKKTAIAFVLLSSTASLAAAQTSVNLYGMLDLAAVSEGGGAAGTVTKLTSGVAAGSRLGFKGSEDLGGGLSAIFLLESGFQADTGTMGQGGLLFGRQAYVGLAGGFGTVTFGRQYTPQFLTQAAVDPFGIGTAGAAPNLLPLTASGGRMDNTVKYATPSFNGLSGELAYGFGEVAGDSSAGRGLGLALGYGKGPLTIRLGYHNRNNDTATLKNTANAKNTLLAGIVDVGFMKAYAGLGLNRGLNSNVLRNAANPYQTRTAPTASTDSRDILLGVVFPAGAGRIIASAIRKNDRTAFNQDATQLALGYFHALSKRTELYAVYGHIDNRNGAGYTVGGAIEAGSGNRAGNLGMRHTF
ncbi:MAG: porin [Pseudomonadota bacterium]